VRLDENASRAWFWRFSGCCALAVLGAYGFLWLVTGLLLPYRKISESVNCQSNVFRMTRGMRMYADDYDDRFLPAEQWMDRLSFYMEGEHRHHCPTVSRPGQERYGYAMNRDAAQQEKGRMESPEKTPLVYDSTNLTRSAFDPVTSLPVPGRHRTRARQGSPSRTGNFIGYADGSGRIKLDSTSASTP
jgi:hypothetical protein